MNPTIIKDRVSVQLNHAHDTKFRLLLTGSHMIQCFDFEANKKIWSKNVNNAIDTQPYSKV